MPRRWEFDDFGGPERLQLRDGPAPSVPDGEVLVRVRFAGVNPVDRSVLAGRFPTVARPHVPGAEGVGVVHQVGAGVEGFRPGQSVALSGRLFCGRCDRCRAGAEPECRRNPQPTTAPWVVGAARPGTWSSFVAVPEQNLVEVPEGMPLETAAALSLDGPVAWRLVDRLTPRAGDRAVVLAAAGGIGIFALQALVLRGLRVAAVSARPEARPILLELGAEEVIDRRGPELAERVATWTHGEGAELVVDPTGAETFPTSLSLLGPGGRFGTCGITTGATASLDLRRLYLLELSVIGSTGARRSDLSTVLELGALGRIRPVIAATFPFEQAPAALGHLDDPARVGKVLLRGSDV